VIGVIYLRDVLQAIVDGKQDSTLRSISHEPLFVPQTQTIDELFDALRRTNRHLALVVNEYGMLQGVVTLEDLLEELVGEIYDESDRPQELVQEVAPGRLLVSGLAEMRMLFDYYGTELPSCKPTDRVSLWVLNHTGRIPAAKESFLIDGFAVKVIQASRRFVQRLEIEPIPIEAARTQSDAGEEAEPERLARERGQA
jgi:CBS domain containing-hemolysin-like protein